MPQLIDIQRVDIGPKTLTARIVVASAAPLTCDEDPAATERVVSLLPEIATHACYGDGAATFGEVVYNTEVAHLLEHVAVELIAQTNLAGDISAGRTRALDADAGVYEVELDCHDDILTAAALSSAAWILDWAFAGGGDPTPDIAGIVEGMVALVASLTGSPSTDTEEASAAEPFTEDPAPFNEDATIIAAPIGNDESTDIAGGPEDK